MLLTICLNLPTLGELPLARPAYAQPRAYRWERYPSDYDFPQVSMGPSQESFRERTDKVSGLTTRESVELFQEAHDKAVDEAHSTLQQSLTGGENAGETVKPKLTLDLRKRNLSQIPKEVVAIIGQDVERYEPSSLATTPSRAFFPFLSFISSFHSARWWSVPT